ncbi:putative quinol monooxygenase [Roseateles sp. P5_E1]
MILVLGHITAHPEHFEEVLQLSRQHVERSRAEPGCLVHAVHRDTENPLRLVFVEQWSDMAVCRPRASSAGRWQRWRPSRRSWSCSMRT